MFERKVLTLFSAPNYCGEFDNAGAVMIVDENLKCSFKILRPAVHKSKFPEEFPDYKRGDKTDGLLDEAPYRERLYEFLHATQTSPKEGDSIVETEGNDCAVEQIREVNS